MQEHIPPLNQGSTRASAKEANLLEGASLSPQAGLPFLQELILSNMGERVILHDREMKIRWANRAACDFYGLPLEAMIGKVCYDLLQRSLEDCRGCPVKGVLQTGMMQHNILSFPEGKTLLINAYPVWQEGDFAGVVEVSLDITERTRIEAELKKAKDESVAASEAKSRFLANVSHEIRTPMNVILGIANLVYESAQSDEQREYLDMIRDSAAMLLTLVNGLLDLSKIEAGKLELAQEYFNLHQAVEKTVASFALQAQKKGLRLSFLIDDNVPKIVKGDAARLQQVLYNLIGNGIKFTEQGEIVVSLQLAPVDEPCQGQGQGQAQNGLACVLFSISDTGIGIPRDKLGRIFQSFIQVDTYQTRKQEGTGLALAITKNLVELMGGTIGVNSVENRGSTFYFTIPYTLAPPAKKEDDLLSGQPGIAPLRQGAGRKENQLQILLVEDKPMNQRLAMALLERKGHRVISANNGREALEKLKSGHFDLILMDVNMPEMDGLEATVHIRAAEEEAGDGHIPIIAMTAYAMQEDRDRCLQAGMDYYISKPIDTQELYDLLDKIKKGGQA